MLLKKAETGKHQLCKMYKGVSMKLICIRCGNYTHFEIDVEALAVGESELDFSILHGDHADVSEKKITFKIDTKIE